MRVVSIAVVLASVASATPANAESDIVLDADGRTIKVAAHVSRFGKFTIEMPAPPDVKLNCGTTPSVFKPGGLELYVQHNAEVREPDVIKRPADEKQIVSHTEGRFVVQPK